MRNAVLSYAMFPVYVWQGLAAKARIERMPPPPGALTGVVGLAPGAARETADVKLLVVGDSAAAGIGVDSISDSLAPRLAERLYAVANHSVFWRTAGSSSAVSSDVRDFIVPNIARDAYTHIVLMIGTNDAKNFHGSRRFKRGFGGLLYALRARWPEARIVWSPPVDFSRVPALPKPLATILEMRADILRRAGARLCLERGAIPATTLPRVEPAGFSRDGFHASAAGHAYYASHLLDYVLGDRLAANRWGAQAGDAVFEGLAQA